MCVNCDDYIVSEVFSALQPLFNEYGQRNVIDVIHNWYHHVQPNNVAQVTLWDKGVGE